MRTLSIFIAEDNRADIDLICEAMRETGLRCEWLIADDSEFAARVVCEIGTERACPDLAIIDLAMPKVEGAELLRLLRANPACQNLPVLVVTSSQSPKDLELISQYRAVHFYKPSDWPEFRKVTELILGMVRA